MYTPKHFSVSDRQELSHFIRNNAFGQLISNHNHRPEASHLPFLLSADGERLTCHLARQNPQLEKLDGQQVLVIFNGPHAYISPRWYQSASVPTWNYQSVHVYGTARTFNDAERLMTLVDQLSQKYESGAEKPWQPEYSPKLLRAITGVEIEISDIQGKYKLSQNRSTEDRQSVVEALRAEQKSEMADAIQRWEPPIESC
ncbi:FMN-binding negative transcriptional regulator [Microbulbifer sp. HZ11]|uniref:FMN-binding negative transcriptional regulator n=1 Tax=Microbulbifer sp. HZ11 TaxID=1453501 RepID=UPI0005BC5CA1|nr:FMN-binding negative transcriptional regulator [Microbulbifer sp. HZ11]